MKKLVSALIAALLVCTSVISQETMAIELPDPSKLGKLASEAASGLVDAAGSAEEVAANIAGDVGEVVSGSVDQVSDVVSGFSSQAGEMLSGWGEAAGETADSVKEKLSDAGVTVKISAEELGTVTVQKVSELTEQAEEAADDAINVVSDAGGFFVDKAGHVVDLAAVATDYASSEAAKALQVLQKHGALLMNLAEDAVSGIDLSKEESWEEAKVAVYTAIENAYDNKFIGDDEISEETVKIVVDIMFAALKYGYQYKNDQITLGEYASFMSGVLIREGIPEGVGYITKYLSADNPLLERLSEGVTYYLISKAYGDKSGEEIEAEEEEFLEGVVEREAKTE